MSAYDPPSETIGVFNSSLFTSTSENITQSYADTHYLKYPTAQSATETINSLTATTLTATNDATINGLTVGKGGSSIGTNTAFGASSLASNTTGSSNTAVGANSLNGVLIGVLNTAVGYNALQVNVASSNTAVGAGSQLSNSSGNQNVSVGRGSLSSNTTGSNNTAVGFEAGYAGTANTIGSNNTYIGYQAQANGSAYSSSTALGSGAIITASNQIVLGTDSETVRYNKVSPLYLTVPTYTSADVGYSELVGSSTITSITTSIQTIMTSSTLPIGTYIYMYSQQFNNASAALDLDVFFRVGTANRHTSSTSVPSGKKICVSFSGMVVQTSANTFNIRVSTSTGTMTALTGNTDDTALRIIRIA